MTEAPTKAGVGLGECPHPWQDGKCSCQHRCRVCGWPKHSAVHMVALGGTPEEDPPYDHEFKGRDDA